MSELYLRLEGVMRGFARARARNGTDTDNLVAEILQELFTLGRQLQRLERCLDESGIVMGFIEQLGARLRLKPSERTPDELLDGLLRTREVREWQQSGTGLEDLRRGLNGWRQRIRTLQVRGWLFRAMKNKLSDLSTASTAREPLPLSDGMAMNHPARGDSAPFRLVKDDLRERRLVAARDCVEELPDIDRRLIRGSLEQSYVELARQLETTENAVGIRLTRLRKVLKKCVEGKVIS